MIFVGRKMFKEVVFTVWSSSEIRFLKAFSDVAGTKPLKCLEFVYKGF